MKQMTHKKWAFWFPAVLACLVGAVGLINYAVDPYQLYRADDVYNQNQRYANVGLAKNHDYDSVIIGTSMADNFSPKYIDEKLGVNVVKLSVAGGTAHEQCITARLALRSHKTRLVIWNLDFQAFEGPVETVSQSYDTPLYLYDENPVNDLKCLLSMDTLQLSFKKAMVKHFGLKSRKFVKGIEDNYNWYEDRKGNFSLKHFKLGLSHANFIDQVDDGGISGKTMDLEAMKRSFDENVEKVVRENPETKFEIFFPPYSAYYYYKAYHDNQANFGCMLAFKRYVYGRLSGHKNVRLYDFQVDREVTHEVSNYADLCHYGPAVNRRIIDCIKEGRFLVTDADEEAYLGILKDDAMRLNTGAFLKDK